MGSHAYCQIIYGIPVGSNYELEPETEEEDSVDVDDLTNCSNLSHYRHGHSACPDGTYYIGVTVYQLSLASKEGQMISPKGLNKSNFRYTKESIIRSLNYHEIPFNESDIGFYNVLTFEE